MAMDAIDRARDSGVRGKVLISVTAAAPAAGRLIYVTSPTIMASIIEYYLESSAGRHPEHARSGFPAFTDGGSVRPLSATLLDRPRLTTHPLADHGPDRRTCALKHQSREELALRLGHPHVRRRSEILSAGTKAAAGEFSARKVPPPLGAKTLEE